MTESNLITHIDERGVAVLTVNRPEVHNAFDETLITYITGTLLQLEDNPDVRVIVLKANGKNFSAGADLRWMQQMVSYSKEENVHDAMALATLMKTLNQVSIPTVAIVQGATVGGGVGLVACCDFVIASEQASFCLSEVKLGLIPAVISPYVVEAIGVRAARRYFLTGEVFSVTTAKQLGLVSEIVPADKLDTAGDEVVNRFLQNGPQAMSAAKELIRAVSHGAIDDAMIALTAELIAMIRVSDEGQEGLTAFLEKRPPYWK
ncbi:enoyl-CoA hydratase/isomerase family protein [Beggiatoa leptomitoformis]|uniref:Gamma-carboxygeranoyl-CoA hydratase n=1 Tax=Beggiatoa leptomitoformis TaxID=288004 RepID=A0A2N9YBW8_9GAMM|nr:enoyl-CoA hydratase/isomerase family protein [Beggiatoa leptomitoformis]AUI67970.1 gamma-carboxygeranoyl-CoA hydratase [Beggiatoa leptomitoformis]QGX03478.1 gamma-carboxygeranoyl-CoA hydratase [Beggiatoa leptomitoformis]